MNEQLIIFDTTLRDGEQSPGASMDLDEKVRIGRALEKLRVDVIEAGFAAASPGDFEAVKAVASAVQQSTVCSLARAMESDLQAAADAIKPANSGRIHTFIATSPIHMQHKLRMQPEEVIERAVYAVKYARNCTDDVEFSAEDAGRSDIDFLCRIIEQAINAGASTINIPDTVGYTVPEQFGQLIQQLIERVPNSDKAIFSVHCHNDLGLAVANSLAAVTHGARQVECTINGLGERAGNASLEEVVMSVKTRKDYFGINSAISTTEIMNCSRLVSSITGFSVQPNKAIVGANAFAHESGIHQDGVIKARETYEIMRAEDVGWSANRMVMGKHSGRNAFKTRLEELGFSFNDNEQLNDAFARFKALADKKHEIFDEDLLSIVNSQENSEESDSIQLTDLRVESRMNVMPTAFVSISHNGETLTAESSGDGPVDAVFQAIKIALKVDAKLQLYSVKSITEGTDSQGDVTVRLEHQGALVHGAGLDTDIIVASAKAYLQAVSRFPTVVDKQHPQMSGMI
ncbi:MAG: 2-isopropylmalate synthase [Arenicella sp.]